MKDDLYRLPIGEARTLCGGNSDGDGTEESCATLAPIVGMPGAVVLGDTKMPGAELRFDADEMKALVVGYARENGITLA